MSKRAKNMEELQKMHAEAVANPSIAAWGAPRLEAEFIKRRGMTPANLRLFRAATHGILEGNRELIKKETIDMMSNMLFELGGMVSNFTLPEIKRRGSGIKDGDLLSMHAEAVANPTLAVWGSPEFEAEFIRRREITPSDLKLFRSVARQIYEAGKDKRDMEKIDTMADLLYELGGSDPDFTLRERRTGKNYELKVEN
jgi:hypothetical protein